jgi:hypothetical protein
MTRITPVFVLLAALAAGCSWTGSEASDSTRIARETSPAQPRPRAPQPRQTGTESAAQGSPHEPLPLKKPEKVSSALAQRAEAILLENREKPVGTTISFTQSGRRYLARIEMHDNPENNPARPPGRHKGITVYEP